MTEEELEKERVEYEEMREGFKAIFNISLPSWEERIHTIERSTICRPECQQLAEREDVPKPSPTLSDSVTHTTKSG